MTKEIKGIVGENEVTIELNKINSYKYILNDITFVNKKSNMSHQIDHVLICKKGIFVIETKNYKNIYYDKVNNAWYTKSNHNIVRINSPLRQNKSHEIALYKILKAKFKVNSIVVFVKNNAPSKVDNVINLNELYNYIISFNTNELLDDKTIDLIKNIIINNKSDVTLEKHLNNIKSIKNNEKKYFCPICKKRLLLANNILHCFNCRKDYKLPAI